MGNTSTKSIGNFDNILSIGKGKSIAFVPEDYLDEDRLKLYAALLDTPIEQLRYILKIVSLSGPKVDPEGMTKIFNFLEANKENPAVLKQFVARVNGALSNMPGEKVRLTLNDAVINKAIQDADADARVAAAPQQQAAATLQQQAVASGEAAATLQQQAAAAAASTASTASIASTAASGEAAPPVALPEAAQGAASTAAFTNKYGNPLYAKDTAGAADLTSGGGIIKELLDKDPLTDKDIQENIDKLVREYPYDYQYGPEAENVNMTDRVIFVATTYIMRAISLFMVEWGIHTGFINNFIKAFSLYFGVYVSVLILLYILTNANLENYLFRTLFYYINGQTENGKGNMRIGIHVLCLLFLFPVPFVVREYRQINNKNLTFTEKRSILNGVEKFTLIAWVLTSIIALRV